MSAEKSHIQLASCLIYSYSRIEYINRFAVDRMVVFHDVTFREIRGRKDDRFLILREKC